LKFVEKQVEQQSQTLPKANSHFFRGEGRRRSKYSIINKDIKSMLEKEEGMLAKIIEKKNKAKQS